jgi:uncharacterized delta-60 repeat protein
MTHSITTPAFILLFLGHSLVHGQAGTLDPTFGTNGTVVLNATAATAPYTYFMDLVPYAQGQLLAVGRSGPGTDPFLSNTHQYLAARFDADGTLDPTFGVDGVLLQVQGGGGSKNYVLNAAVLDDERIVTYGYCSGPLVGGITGTPCVWRLLPNGDPDSTHGFNGLTAPYNVQGGVIHVPRSMSLSLAGDPLVLAMGLQPRVDQLNEDGTQTFNYNTDFNFAPPADLLGSRMQTDGKLLVYGTRLTDGGPNRAVVSRLLANGQRDLDFGALGNGVVSWDATDRDDIALDAALDENGNIFLLNGGPSILKLLPNGLPDPAFGVDGVLELTLTSGFWPYGDEDYYEVVMSTIVNGFEPHDRHGAIAVDELGRIVIALFNGLDDISPAAHHVLRLLPDGSLDASFGTNGIADLPLTSAWTHIQRLITTPQRILLAGSVKEPGAGSRTNALLLAVRATSSTGVERAVDAQVRLQAAPNPVHAGDVLTVWGVPQGGVVDLFDASGRQVVGPLRMGNSVGAPARFQVPAQLASGTYLLRGTPQAGGLPSTLRLVVVDR